MHLSIENFLNWNYFGFMHTCVDRHIAFINLNGYAHMAILYAQITNPTLEIVQKKSFFILKHLNMWFEQSNDYFWKITVENCPKGSFVDLFLNSAATKF